ncbi:DUF1810 domain-containing protein [Tranquillimonas alkanivorans]|uniref:Uncharacterized protein, DUF1810 family n=1 Tax=Tranquillimonas alkanivorans TaxID=441119 RepID=A0A1I5U4C9_9RHOB|nr:DUF1810 domain-containing protein [Tranquillimonas alkanivorans]SFP90124.1 Uncharacterized protein, DUF1810 family [Tranquillimonas alkanivorans]
MNLQRFLDAQEGVIDTAMDELRAGGKRSHWMWFVFPQLRGLGRSSTAQYYGIEDLEEAAAYLAHPVLGARLIECNQLMLGHAGTPPEAILGGVDAMKLRSSATLFDTLPGADPVFADVLADIYGKQRCERTLHLLGAD